MRRISRILSKKIERLGKHPHIKSSEDLYLNASREVIRHFVGIDTSKPEIDPFFDMIDKNGVASHIHVNRVTLLAESLFLIRDTKGFREFCQRIKDRSVRSSVFEMLAAKQFYKAGFDLLAKPEIGVKGEDFDFSAVKDGVEVNVEVTALTAVRFSESTVYNALSHKRSQLPADKPCVIFCVFPPAWVDLPYDWNEKPKLISDRFFRSTKRVNAVVFWAEKHLSDSKFNNGMLGLLRQPFSNANARHKTNDLDFLMSGTPANPVLQSYKDPRNRDSLAKDSNNLEFYRWIDELASKAV